MYCSIERHPVDGAMKRCNHTNIGQNSTDRGNAIRQLDVGCFKRTAGVADGSMHNASL